MTSPRFAFYSGMGNLKLKHFYVVLANFILFGSAFAQTNPQVASNYGPRKTSPSETVYNIQNSKDAKTGQFVDESQPLPQYYTGKTQVVQLVRERKDSNGDKVNEAAILAIPYTAPAPNALDIIRKELQRLHRLDQEKSAGRHWMTEATLKLTPETLTFFVLGGANTYSTMWIKSHGDPLAMQRQIESITDPVAHFSFWAFMAANGHYMSNATKGMDVITKMQSMKLLNYKGMMRGSLVSALVGDMGQTIKGCWASMAQSKNDEKSREQCESALQIWTTRGMFTRYLPQVAGLMAAQYASETVQKAGSKFFQKIESTSLAQRILNKKWLVSQAYKITGADVALTFSGGKFTMKAIKWVGHATQIEIFLVTDHILNTYMYRGVNNLILPLLFDFGAAGINKYLEAYEKGLWDDKKIQLPRSDCREISICKDSLEMEIQNYTKQTQQWREHLNADAESDLAGWMEMTKKLLNQVDYAYQYYGAFISTLRESLNLSTEVKNGMTTDVYDKKTLYPYRALPLYGVSMGKIIVQGGSASDLYLSRPWEIQSRQLENIESVMAQVRTWDVPLGLKTLAKYNKIVAKLSSKDIKTISSGLNDMNQLMGITEATSEENEISTYPFTNLYYMLSKIRALLGAPLPVVYQFAGFSQAFLVNNAYSEIGKSADYSLWSVADKYKFNKETDLMFYKLICGTATASFDTHRVFGKDIFIPQFSPPSLLKPGADSKDFCSTYRSTNNLYSTTIGQKKLSEFLNENLNYGIIGDYMKKDTANTFDKWWLANSKNIVSKEFAKYDENYRGIVELALSNITGTRSLAKRTLDHLNQSRYLQDSLQDQFKVDIEFYLQISQRALAEGTFTQVKKDFFNYTNYLEQIVFSSRKPQFEGYNGVTHPSVKMTSQLLNDYMQLFNQPKINFEDYIARAKKIDGAINDILVDAKLKKLQESKKEVAADNKKVDAEIDPFSDAAAKTPSITGTETTDKVYEDIKVESPNARQRAVLAAVQGLRQVEAEIKRFIKMKIMLAQTLEIDQKEFMKEWGSAQAKEGKPCKLSFQ